MDHNYQQLSMEEDGYPNAEQLLPSCSKCFGMDENCEHDGIVWPFEEMDPTLFQSQGPTSYLRDIDILAQPRTHPQTLFNYPNVGQSVNEVPLSSEPGFVSNSIDSTYTVGDRVLSAGPSQSREYSTSTPNSGPPGSQTEESLRQLNIQDDPSQGPPQGLQRRSTYAQVAALPSPDRLHPHYGQGPSDKKPIRLPMRSMARSVPASSRPADVQSTTSTTRSGKRKRSSSPPSASQSEPSKPKLKCNHPHCYKTFNSTSDLNHHQMNHKAQEDRPFRCDFEDCGMGFLWLKDLSRHQTKHTKKKDFICSVFVNGKLCGQKYTRKDNLLRHRQHAHPDAPPLSSTGSSQLNT